MKIFFLKACKKTLILKNNHIKNNLKKLKKSLALLGLGKPGSPTWPISSRPVQLVP
jgi:hypothetical protein